MQGAYILFASREIFSEDVIGGQIFNAVLGNKVGN